MLGIHTGIIKSGVILRLGKIKEYDEVRTAGRTADTFRLNPQ